MATAVALALLLLSFFPGKPARTTAWKFVLAQILRGTLALAVIVSMLVLVANTNRLLYRSAKARESSAHMLADFEAYSQSLGKMPGDPKVVLVKTFLTKLAAAAACTEPRGVYFPSVSSAICYEWTSELAEKLDAAATSAELLALAELHISVTQRQWLAIYSDNDHSVIEVQFGTDGDPLMRRWLLDNAFAGSYVGAAYEEQTQLKKYKERSPATWHLRCR